MRSFGLRSGPFRFGALVPASLLLAGTAGVLALLLATVLVSSLNRAERRAQGWVEHTLEVIVSAKQAGLDLEEASAAGRGFFLTHGGDEIRRLDAASARVVAETANLEALTGDNLRQQRAVAQFADAAKQRLATLRLGIAYLDTGDMIGFSRLARQQTGQHLMDQAMGGLGYVVAEERSLLVARSRSVSRLDRALMVTGIGGGVLLAICLAGLIAAVFWVRQRRRLVARLRVRVDVRTAALRASEARFRAYFEQAPDGLMVFAVAEGGLVCKRANAASARVLGIGAEVLVGMQLREMLDPAAAEAMETCATGAITWGTPSACSIQMAGAGEAHTLDVTMAVWPGVGDGQRVLVSLRDVTERVELEQRLRQTQKTEAVGRLAAGLAHDFNNVLQAISGNLELLEERPRPWEETHRLAKAAAEAARRGASLTGATLNYVRKQSMIARAIDVAALLEDLQEMLSRTLGPHIAVRQRAAAGLPFVRTDPDQLQTAIINLALNAAHAMPQGGTLTLEAAERAWRQDGPMQVVIAVADTGTGIDATTLPHVFEPFFSTKGAHGSGLGLATVQEFARRSDGDVRIDSAPGRGTRVELCLPPAPVQVVAADAESFTFADLGPARVLLVDDMPDVLRVTAAFLDKAGLEVTAYGSAEEASADPGRFDALVTDYAMPGMNGLDLIRACRARQPGLPAIIITGLALDATLSDLPEGVAVLRKPFTRARLLDTLAIVMEPAGDPAPGLAEAAV